MDAGTRRINDIFNGSRLLEIPFFQRSYVWDVEQWERLLNDMEYITRYQTPHFMGSVILKQQTTSSSSEIGDIRLVIDGQQRLTTLAIFFKVVSLLDPSQIKFFEREFKLANEECVIRHNFYDTDVFNKIMSLEDLVEMRGEHKIIRAYNWFRNNIDIEKLDIKIIKNRILFVGIDISNDEEEQQIFETINSTGVKLTTGELLKNYFFNREDVSLYEKTWKPIFENDSECISYWDEEVSAGRAKKSNLELFFFSLLQIKLQDKSLKVRTEDKNSLGRFDGLFNNYKSFINKYSISKTDFLNEIIEYAKIYKEHFDSQIIDQHLTSKYGIARINAIIYGLENTTIIPYILYVLKNTSDIEEQNRIFKYIETYIIRRIICKCSNKNYNNLFSENLIGNEILTYHKLETYIKNLSEQNNSIPNDKDLFIGFENNILTNKQALGVLYLLESAIRTDAFYSTALLGLSKYTLEHLMPKKWRNHWDILDTEKENSERDHILQTLGNLAIITGSLNSSIRDAKWDIKLNGKSAKLGLKAYASGLQTMSDVLDKDIWNEEYIRKRCVNLYKNAVSIWNIDDDSFDIDSYLNKIQENVILENGIEQVIENHNLPQYDLNVTVEGNQNKDSFVNIQTNPDYPTKDEYKEQCEKELIEFYHKNKNIPPIIINKLPKDCSQSDFRGEENGSPRKYSIYDIEFYITARRFCIENSGIKRKRQFIYFPKSNKFVLCDDRYTGFIPAIKGECKRQRINIKDSDFQVENESNRINQSEAFDNIEKMFEELQENLKDTSPQILPEKFGDLIDGKYIYKNNIIFIISRNCIEKSGIKRINKAIYNPHNGKIRMSGSITSFRKILDKIEKECNIVGCRHEEIIEKIIIKLQSYYGDYIELNNNFTLKDIDSYIDNNPNSVGRFIINNIRFTLTRVSGVVENSGIKRHKRYYFIKENSDKLMYFDSITNARNKFKII